jgi:hypothetical protein
MLRTDIILYFDVTLPFATPKSSCGRALMLPRGRCTGKARRCKAKQDRRGKTALKFVSYFHSSTVFGRRREGKRISLVTMTALFSSSWRKEMIAMWPVTLTQSSRAEPGDRSRGWMSGESSIDGCLRQISKLSANQENATITAELTNADGRIRGISWRPERSRQLHT